MDDDARAKRARQLAGSAREFASLQQHCRHIWSEWKPFSVQSHKQEAIPGEYDVQGVDIYPKYRLVPATKFYWYRECKICLKREESRSERKPNY